MIALSTQEAFEQFHEENPRVYEELRSLAIQAVKKGRKKIGISMLYEVVRWNRYLKTSDEEFKINNNFKPHYARLLMERNKELEGLFELRGLWS